MAVKLTVPKGWKKGTIGELVVGIRGVTFASEDVLAAPNDSSVMLLRSNNIKDGRINFEEVYHLPPTYVSDAQTARMGDVAVCMSNGSKRLVGKAARISKNDAERKIAVGAFCALFRPTTNADPHFVPYLFDTESYRRELHITLSGSAINNLKNSDIEGIKIPLPPLAEQRKIAEILRTWDEAIETAEAELKAKQERKRWLMDKLLVGNWPKRTIEELFELEGSGIDKVILPDEQVVSLVNYMDAYRKRVLKRADVQAETSVSPNDLMRCQLKRGDIVLTPSSETPDDIAHSALINFEPGNAVHSYHLFRLRARSDDEIVHDFRAFFLNHISVRRQFIRICSGTTRFTLTLPGVRAIKVSLPPIKHQQYAAEVLNDATSQEELASQHVESLRAQKRGLIQKLLTGEVRVAT